MGKCETINRKYNRRSSIFDIFHLSLSFLFYFFVSVENEHVPAFPNFLYSSVQSVVQLLSAAV